MYSKDLLASNFKRNHSIISDFVKDVSNEESRIDPQPNGNNINWVIGHIVVYRSLTLETLGKEALMNEDDTKPYHYGSDKLAKDQGQDLEKLMVLFNESQEKLEEAFSDLSDEKLNQKPEEENKSPLGAVLDFRTFHEAYHMGQLTLLRSIIGKSNLR